MGARGRVGGHHPRTPAAPRADGPRPRRRLGIRRAARRGSRAQRRRLEVGQLAAAELRLSRRDDSVPAIVARYRTLEPLVVRDIDDAQRGLGGRVALVPGPRIAPASTSRSSPAASASATSAWRWPHEPRDWQADEIALVTRVSQIVAVMLARHRAEASLRTSEARLGALLDGSQDLVVVVNVAGGSPTPTARSSGHSATRRMSFVGVHVSTVVHPRRLGARRRASRDAARRRAHAADDVATDSRRRDGRMVGDHRRAGSPDSWPTVVC